MGRGASYLRRRPNRSPAKPGAPVHDAESRQRGRLVRPRPPADRLGRPRPAHVDSALLAVGFFGAFTTFSDFAYKAAMLFTAGERGRAGVYVTASLGLGLVSRVAGLVLGQLAGYPGASEASCQAFQSPLSPCVAASCEFDAKTGESAHYPGGVSVQ